MTDRTALKHQVDDPAVLPLKAAEAYRCLLISGRFYCPVSRFQEIGVKTFIFEMFKNNEAISCVFQDYK